MRQGRTLCKNGACVRDMESPGNIAGLHRGKFVRTRRRIFGELNFFVEMLQFFYRRQV